ncbi:MAG: outer membrane protein assembly factor BamA [Hyphomicrobiaceae bacterium]|nr:outer membrane protein assembly factor BamA [Hyphomicrobiaceae bacterium]
MPQYKTSIGGWRLAVWLALLAPVCFAADAIVFSTAAHAQGAIREIRVTGNRRLEPETVRSYLKFSVGDTYSAGAADRSLTALFGTGLFSDVRIDREGSAVVVTVVENPVVAQVAFEGNSEVEASTLASEVQLKPRSVFTRAKAQADVQRILDVYRRQGRFAANVEPKLIELDQNRVNVVFEITEGMATKVKGINFVGNRAFSDSQLRDIISTTESGWLDFIKGTAIYDPDRMNLDRELLRQYYLKNGYADARIVAGNAELDRDGTGFYITFAVEEGEIYHFGGVTIESSLPDINAQSFYGNILTLQGDVYNGAQIDKTVEKLTLAIAEQGYAFARVRPRANPDFASRTISLTYIIDEGPRVYIDRINVSGNTRTKDHVIRREFRLVEGDAYNPMLVDRAKKRLEALGLFKSVKVGRTPGSGADRVALDVQVEEQSTGELSFGAGYSTSEGVIGDISISERNLLGNGQFLRLKLAGSLERFQIDLSFTEPRFLDMNLAAGFDLFHKEVDQSSTSGFKSRKTGATLRLGYPLAESLWMQNYYTFSRDEIFDVESNASLAIKDACGDANINDPLNQDGDPTTHAAADCQDEVYYTSLVGTSLTFDKRNHPKNPTSGYWLNASVDVAGLGGDAQYVRFSGEGRAYYPITEKITFVGRAVAGHIQSWGGDDIRILDLYFRGGETIRGFERSGIGPRDATNADALGGKTYWAATAEVRFPLPLIPDDIGMSGAVFADAGSLFGASERAKNAVGVNLQDDSTIRSSVGASILWNSPVGPLRVDFAKVLTKEKYDEEQFFRFGASTKF